MASKQEDENYWNQSNFKPFSFDDEDLSSKSQIFGSSVSSSIIADIIFDGVPTVEKPDLQKRPLETLISKNSLDRIFSDGPFIKPQKVSLEEELRILRRKIDDQWVPPSVLKTIKCIILGQPFSLHLYRSLDLKKELLDEAIKSGDGNAILAIVLHLSKTLKKSIFYQVIQMQPIAISQYANYLETRLMISDLIDLLEMSGQIREAAMKQYTYIVQGTQNIETKIQRLTACYSNHFSSLDLRDKDLVQNYLKYLQWTTSLESPIFSSIPKTSVLSSLEYLCKNFWNEPKVSKHSPWFLIPFQGITERQVQWIILTSRSSKQSWDDIEAHFLAKGWLSARKLKSIIPIEKIITELHQWKAPYKILAQYFDVMSSFDRRLELAKQLPCHLAVIDVYVLMKDRRGIEEYKINLKPQSEEYLHAENALRLQIKWKN
ncbi:conserved hypothetical protein [Pediculus humanus corporis]|uniref:Vps16 C-terminal domain-containing protein n=1 Tax=Pediculus humanus subsp. corporis TaxID=121224 RepID=E0VPD5_PEDHC|nr:uncharacterized protein Phum_PHUM357530 [Pediculus humanus corporis]EEB15241.1 conserved hypothetical protein [Pediculus humanus corporis]